MSAEQTIILGCAGMSVLAEPLRQRHSVPILDSIRCAAALVSAMLDVEERVMT